DSRYCSTWYPIIHRHSIHGSWKAGRPPTIQSAIGSYGGILHQAGGLRTTGFLNSVGRAGNTKSRQDNTTIIRFLKSSRTSIGDALKREKPFMMSCDYGWNTVSSVFALTRSGICSRMSSFVTIHKTLTSGQESLRN